MFKLRFVDFKTYGIVMKNVYEVKTYNKWKTEIRFST